MNFFLRFLLNLNFLVLFVLDFYLPGGMAHPIVFLSRTYLTGFFSPPPPGMSTAPATRDAALSTLFPAALSRVRASPHESRFFMLQVN